MKSFVPVKSRRQMKSSYAGVVAMAILCPVVKVEVGVMPEEVFSMRVQFPARSSADVAVAVWRSV